MLAAAEIRAGDAEIVVAGGMENMNLAPYLLPKARFGYRLGDGTLVDAALRDGLWCAFEDCHMGTHAERVAIHDYGQPRGPGRVRPGVASAGDRGDRRRPVRRRAGAGHRSATRRAARRSSTSDEGPRRDTTPRRWPG